MKKDFFKRAQFLVSVNSLDKLPPSYVEIAFAGRSNAGKSSLINALCSKTIAKVAKTTGKTQGINAFSLPEGRFLIDLPGYGFAKVPSEVRGDWKTMIELYFTARRSLKAIFLIINAYVGPTQQDMQMLDWLTRHEVEFCLVVNKVDQLTQAQLAQLRQDMPNKLNIPAKNIAWVSAKKNIGIEELAALLLDYF